MQGGVWKSQCGGEYQSQHCSTWPGRRVSREQCRLTSAEWCQGCGVQDSQLMLWLSSMIKLIVMATITTPNR